MYCMGANITHSWFKTAPNYKPWILSSKIEELSFLVCNTNRSKIRIFFHISALFQCRNITQKCNKTSCCIVAWSRQTFWFKLNLLLPKNESVLNNFKDSLEAYSLSNICKIVLEYTLKYSQLISSPDNKKILLTTRNVRLDSGRYATKYYYLRSIMRQTRLGPSIVLK